MQTSNHERLKGRQAAAPAARSPRRQRLVSHLHDAGPRPVLEALLAVEAGAQLDQVLEDFARVPISIYRAVGASDLAIGQMIVVEEGGR
jgi:hypothetical protein